MCAPIELVELIQEARTRLVVGRYRLRLRHRERRLLLGSLLRVARAMTYGDAIDIDGRDEAQMGG